MPYLSDFDSYDPQSLTAEILSAVEEAILGVSYTWDDELENEENLEQFLDKIVKELEDDDGLTSKIIEEIYDHSDALMDEVYEFGSDAGSESGYENGYEDGQSEYYRLQSDYEDLQEQYDSLEEHFSELEKEADELRDLKEKQDTLEELDLNEVRQSLLDDLRAELESSDLDDVL